MSKLEAEKYIKQHQSEYHELLKLAPEIAEMHIIDQRSYLERFINS